MRTTFELERLLSYVRIRDVWFTADDALNVLRKSATTLFHYSGFESWEVSYRGSCSLVQYRGRYFCVATRHQISGLEVEGIAILADGVNRYLTSGGFSTLGDSDKLKESDQYDLVILDYSKPVASGKIDENKFHAIGTEYLRDNEEVVCMILYGYASSDQRFDTIDDRDFGERLSHLHLAKREILCNYFGDSYESSVFKLRSVEKLSCDFNGISGAPVFAISGPPGDFCAKFAGLVVRAGNGVIHCIKHTAITRLLDRYLE